MQDMSLSLHFSYASSPKHNDRTGSFVWKEGHIKSGGDYKILKNESLKNAYRKLFDKAVNDFNQKEQRKDRKIADYYKSLEAKSKTSKTIHTCAELVLSIGSVLNRPSSEICEKILLSYFRDFEVRNPNIYVTQCVYHNDEVASMVQTDGTVKELDSTPHMHIQFIPFAHSKRGLKVKNSFQGALAEQGFVSTSNYKRESAFSKWIESERKVFEKACNDNGITIHPPQRGRKLYYTPKEYKQLKKEQDILNYEINSLKAKKAKTLEEIQDVIKKSPKEYVLEKKIEALEKENKALRAKVQVFDKVMTFIKEKLPEAFLRVLETFKDEIVPVERTKQMKEKAKSKEIDPN